MTLKNSFFIASLPIASFILASCSQLSNGPSFGHNAQALKQIGGGQYVSIGAGSMKQKGRAQEAFHKKAQQKQKSGSYSYRCEIQKVAHARTSNGAAIPFGAGPIAGGAMILGNVVAMQQERPSTYAASGNTTPQKPLSISKGSAVAMQVVTSPHALETITPTDRGIIKSNLVTAIKTLGLNVKTRASYTLTCSIVRASEQDKWISVELTLKNRQSGRLTKGFLMAEKKSSSGAYQIHEQLTETLREMVHIR